MNDELHKLLESFAHLRDLPQYKNLRAKVVARIQELEDSLEPKPEPKPTPTRRVIPSNPGGPSGHP